MSGRLARTVASSRSTVVRLTVPTDANFTGNVFGGVILSEIDRVALVTATRHSGLTCVTASFDRVSFLAPVNVGQVLTFDSRMTFVGNSSMEIWVEVRAEDLAGGPARLVGDAFVTMVAVGPDGRPSPVRRLELANDEERRLFREGEARMAERRAQRVASGATAASAEEKHR